MSTDFLHYKSAEAVMDSMVAYPLPTSQLVGKVSSVLGDRCQVEMILDGERVAVNVRIAPVMAGLVYTEQLVLLEDDLLGSYVLVGALSTSYHLGLSRFFTKEELARYMAAKDRLVHGTAWSRIIGRLNTPVKRLGGLVLAVGIVVLVIGLIQIVGDMGRGGSMGVFFERWFKAAFQDRWYFRRFPMSALGTYLFVIGLLFSFAYDRTIGRVLTWIYHGR